MLLLLVVVVACGGRETRSKEPKELDTVDIDARYDAELSTETDVKERRNQAAMAGRLPSDFPEGL